MSIESISYQVLIVEDEYFIASDLARAVREAGWIALGPVADPVAALTLIDAARVDFAVVDINLNGSISFAVAAELRRRAIPFLFHTGYDGSVIDQQFADILLLQKPRDGEAIVADIKRARVTIGPGPS